jgi:hypothetical protein
MRRIRLDMSGFSPDRIVVNLGDRAVLTAQIGYDRVSRELTPREAQALERALDALDLPLLPMGEPAGLDGVTYHLKLSSGGASVEYAWWCDSPKNWAPLMGIVRRLVRLSGLKVIPAIR